MTTHWAGMGYITDEDGNVTGLDPVKYLNSLGMGNGTGSGDTYNTVINLLNPQDKKENSSILDGFKNKLLKQVIEGKDQGGYDPMKLFLGNKDSLIQTVTSSTSISSKIN